MWITRENDFFSYECFRIFLLIFEDLSSYTEVFRFSGFSFLVLLATGGHFYPQILGIWAILVKNRSEVWYSTVIQLTKWEKIFLKGLSHLGTIMGPTIMYNFYAKLIWIFWPKSRRIFDLKMFHYSRVKYVSEGKMNPITSYCILLSLLVINIQVASRVAKRLKT